MTGSEQPTAPDQDRPGPSRRALLTTSLGVLAGAAVGVGATAAVENGRGTAESAGAETTGAGTTGTTTPSARHATTGVPAAVHGDTQAGIDRPGTPQTFTFAQVADLADPGDVSFLAGLGERIAALIARPPAGLLPDGPRGLTVTVGLGPRPVAALGSKLPGAEALPVFRGDDQIAERARGGDVLLACCADDPSILPPVVDDLLGRVAGATRRWSQFGYRGPGSGTVARNPLGFLDGISVPHTSKEFAANVWLDDPLPGATICVIRRLRLDITGFTGLSVTRRERVIGRRLDGVPLSGGTPDGEVNLDAKNPDGTYLIPIDAHVRKASPLRTGSFHMLRRSYSFDNGAGDVGLLFTCFQRDVRTFAITQQQLDQGDQLMQFVTPTASATFLVLPGYTEKAPLGSSLPA